MDTRHGIAAEANLAVRCPGKAEEPGGVVAKGHLRGQPDREGLAEQGGRHGRRGPKPSRDHQ
eukprot:3204143-Lingulodinium_polyedra.AAC.1